MPFFLETYDPYRALGAKLLYPGREISEQVEADRIKRFENYAKYWLYYDNKQYEEENQARIAAEGRDPKERLPEHLRKHEYSGVIGDSVDFIIDQLMEEVSVEVEVVNEVEEETKSMELEGSKPKEAKVPEEQILMEDVWQFNEMDMMAPDLGREAIVSGDSYVLLTWDEIEQKVKIIAYSADMVDPVYSQDNYDKYDRVTITYAKREIIDSIEQWVDYKEEYMLLMNEAGFLECVKNVFINDEDKPRWTTILGLPFIPIIHVRALRTRLRQSFGDSLIEKVIGDADRYNAICQLEYLIGRYNSTGHLALFGEAAKIDAKQLYLGSDVADFYAFDNAVTAQTIFLPTDDTIINSQKATLERHMYKKFGLQKMELEDFSGFGAPSGYALEIINRKSEGVFRRIRKEITKAFNKIFDMMLDITAIRMSSSLEHWLVDAQVIYPNRDVKFNFGSVYVVDDQQIRDDYAQGLISLRKALMLKGYSENEAVQIIRQMKEEKEFLGGAGLEGIQAILQSRMQQGKTQPGTMTEKQAQEKQAQEKKV